MMIALVAATTERADPSKREATDQVVKAALPYYLFCNDRAPWRGTRHTAHDVTGGLFNDLFLDCHRRRRRDFSRLWQCLWSPL